MYCGATIRTYFWAHYSGLTWPTEAIRYHHVIQLPDHTELSWSRLWSWFIAPLNVLKGIPAANSMHVIREGVVFDVPAKDSRFDFVLVSQ